MRKEGHMTIELIVERFERLDRDVETLSKVLLIFIALLAARAIFLIYEQKLSELWGILSPMAALVAALLVARIATRLIMNNNLLRTDDRRHDVVRITHHLLAITMDLQSRVNYVKVLLTNGNLPVFVLRDLASTIERRYEALLERDAYKYLPGPTVDLICQMSGSIFGICSLAGGLEKATTDQPMASIGSVPSPERDAMVASVEELLGKITNLIDNIYEVRNSINPAGAKQ